MPKVEIGVTHVKFLELGEIRRGEDGFDDLRGEWIVIIELLPRSFWIMGPKYQFF